MPTDFNFDRAEYFPSNDLAYAMYKQRVLEVLASPIVYPLEINDCIEIHQCMLIVDKHQDLFSDCNYSHLIETAKSYITDAYSSVNTLLKSIALSDVFEIIEKQYISQFWILLNACDAYKHIEGADFAGTLLANPYVLSDVLCCKPLVCRFDEEIASCMKSLPRESAELIILQVGTRNHSDRKIYLPASLTPKDIDEIMLRYLSDRDPNLNHVRILTTWPPSAKSVYNPSRKVKTTAARIADELNDSMFGSDAIAIVSHGVGVSITPDQVACKGISIEGNNYTLTFSRDWLIRHTEPGTILNNFIYVFDFINRQELLSAPAHKHERSALFDSLGLHPKDEYPVSIPFNMRNTQVLITVLAYRRLLHSVDIRLEAAVEWFFNTYIQDEFGITGFHVNMPSEHATFLEKCKSIGPEIEGALKAYQLFYEDGEIDPAALSFMTSKQFSEFPSFIEKKYLIEGEAFEPCARTMFSDQSGLAYSDVHKGANTFFDIVNTGHARISDFHEVYHSLLADLEERAFIETDNTGSISLTKRAFVLHGVWVDGAISIHLFSDEIKRLAAKLVEEGYLEYRSRLFTPDEANYFSYMFNNASFSNAIALRNKYDHASSLYPDPDAQAIEEDYCRLLGLMIQLVLKLNAELSSKTGRGGVKDFVDWPWVDDTVETAANQILL